MLDTLRCFYRLFVFVVGIISEKLDLNMISLCEFEFDMLCRLAWMGRRLEGTVIAFVGCGTPLFVSKACTYLHL